METSLIFSAADQPPAADSPCNLIRALRHIQSQNLYRHLKTRLSHPYRSRYKDSSSPESVSCHPNPEYGVHPHRIFSILKNHSSSPFRFRKIMNGSVNTIFLPSKIIFLVASAIKPRRNHHFYALKMIPITGRNFPTKKIFDIHAAVFFKPYFSSARRRFITEYSIS